MQNHFVQCSGCRSSNVVFTTVNCSNVEVLVGNVDSNNFRAGKIITNICLDCKRCLSQYANDLPARAPLPTISPVIFPSVFPRTPTYNHIPHAPTQLVAPLPQAVLTLPCALPQMTSLIPPIPAFSTAPQMNFPVSEDNTSDESSEEYDSDDESIDANNAVLAPISAPLSASLLAPLPQSERGTSVQEVTLAVNELDFTQRLFLDRNHQFVVQESGGNVLVVGRYIAGERRIVPLTDDEITIARDLGLNVVPFEANKFVGFNY